MKIAGLHKLTLLDYPDKVACTVFMPGCNFRCPFCHNTALVLPERFSGEISQEDVLAFLNKRAGILDGVCVSGGEPLLHKDLASFLIKVKALGYAVKLDTNGSNPDFMRQLMDEGLIDYVAMDIKNSLKKYPETAGVPELDLKAIIYSVELLMQERIPFEFRTTLVREFHTRDDILEIGQWLQGASRCFLQRFVDSGDLLGESLHPVEVNEMREMADLLRPYFREVGIRGI